MRYNFDTALLQVIADVVISAIRYRFTHTLWFVARK